MVWRPSVCLSRRRTYRDSPGGSMRRGHRTFQPDNKEDRHILYLFVDSRKFFLPHGVFGASVGITLRPMVSEN